MTGHQHYFQLPKVYYLCWSWVSNRTEKQNGHSVCSVTQKVKLWKPLTFSCSKKASKTKKSWAKCKCVKTKDISMHIILFNKMQREDVAKWLQSCPTLCDPRDGSPPGSPIPGTLQARTLEWVAISFSSAWKWKVKVKSLSRVRPPATPWTAAHQAPPSMGFPRQEYWSGVPLPSPERGC